jgi:hypothetical protein
MNILPLTTLRTIDLEGEKNSDPLFSRFYAEMSVFFEGNIAPKCVHENQKTLDTGLAGTFVRRRVNVGAV